MVRTMTGTPKGQVEYTVDGRAYVLSVAAAKAIIQRHWVLIMSSASWLVLDSRK